ncbi:little elongation complex subunit 2-like [Gasterosteus aculeatus]
MELVCSHQCAHFKKALLRRLPDDWKQNVSCGFKPSKSLNILHHLLKKLTGLEEGRYLIAHKAGEPFATLLKAANGKASRGAYDLQKLHNSVPRPLAPGLVPWIPVDPAVVMSFHKKHRRVPCKFSPKLLGQVCSELASPALKDETVKKEKKTALEVMSRQLS